MLKQCLSGLLAKEEIGLLHSSFDVIGDIAVIKIPPELSEREQIIADTILAKMKNVRTVLKQDSPVRGEFRTREVSYVSGEKKFTAIYKENQCLFKVDVSKVYFSPRLSTERKRIASLVKEGERILNMFAGIDQNQFGGNIQNAVQQSGLSAVRNVFSAERTRGFVLQHAAQLDATF